MTALFGQLNPEAYLAGYAYGLSPAPSGRFAQGYTGAELRGPGDPPSKLAIAYSAYCEGYAASTGLRMRLAKLGLSPWPVANDRLSPASDYQHTCEAGPLCSGYELANPDCCHNSCQRIINEPAWCRPCMAAETADMAKIMAEDAALNACCQAGYCPDCGAPLMMLGLYGAPGIGQSWACTAQDLLAPQADRHNFAKVGGRFYRPEDGAHLMSPEQTR